MGKPCLVLCAIMMALAFYPKTQVFGAPLDDPLVKDIIPEEPLVNRHMGVNIDQDRESDRELDRESDRDEEYDYDFMRQSPYGGGFPRNLRSMQRRERLMKRFRRFAGMENRGRDLPPFGPPIE